MKTITIATGMSLVLFASASATATSLSYNMPYTSACFDAAAIRDSTGLIHCNAAISRETTTSGGNRTANLVNRGILQLVSNNLSGAAHDFDAALAIDPDQPEALLGKAIQEWQTGNSSAAVTLASQSLQNHPQRPAVAYLVRGLANEQQGQLKAAYSDLQRARQLEPYWSEPADQLQRYRVVNR